MYQNLFAATFIAVGVGYEMMALSMPLGGFGSPGPGLFPVIVGGVLILTSVACLIQNVVSAEPPAPLLDDAGGPPLVRGKGSALKAWLLIGSLILYVIALKPLGFPVALTLLLLASIRLFGYRNWPRAAALAVFMTVLAYIAFIVWLKVPLPLGILAPLLY